MPQQLNLVAAMKKVSKPTRSSPLWAGPEGAGPQGGCTQSLIGRWLACRERARLYLIEGFRTTERWEPRTGYGDMWHVAEEALAKRAPQDSRKWSDGQSQSWENALTNHCKALCKTHRLQQEDVDKWFNVCRVQFPLYVDYWRKHPDVTQRTPLLAEFPFDVPYELSSGRTVRLRGKWDSVDLVRGDGVYLQENKTKSDIDQAKIQRQIGFDLQTMFYLVALERSQEQVPKEVARYLGAIKGIRYNVIRRPLSGGKGTIVRHKATKNQPEETKADYYARLSGIIGGSPQDYFARWKIGITPADISRFRHECLDPILEAMALWYEDVTNCPDNDPFYSGLNWRHPYGCWNSVNEVGWSDVDGFLESGSTVGLTKVETLFRELEP